MKVLQLIFVTVFIVVKTVSAQKQLAPPLEIKTVQISEPQLDQTTHCNFSHDGDAHFVGGEKALMLFIYDNFKLKPLPTGRIITVFTIEKDGSLSDIQVVKGLNKQANDEAIRVIRSMPKWTPAIQAGKPVRTAFAMPLNFGEANVVKN